MNLSILKNVLAGNSNPPLELFLFLSLRYQAGNQQMGAGKWQGKMVIGAVLPICLKYYEVSVHLTRQLETLKPLVKSMLFKQHSGLLTSKLHLLWHHLYIHNGLPTVSLIILFCSSRQVFLFISSYKPFQVPQILNFPFLKKNLPWPLSLTCHFFCF